MFNKLTQSQSTLQSLYPAYHNPTMPLRDAQSSIRNPYPQKVPLKFPKNRVRKQTSQHILAQTTQNPEPYSVRPYQFANHSRIFHHNAPLTPSQRMTKHPLDRFDNADAKRLFSPGFYHNLSLDSAPKPVQLRKYEDIGAIQNSKRSFQKMHYKPDPIVTGQKDLRHNSSLERVWGEERRYRDHGVNAEKLMVWKPKTPKREAYRPREKMTTYTERHKAKVERGR